MRFRHQTCRYSEVSPSAGQRTLGELWAVTQRLHVRPEWRPPLDLYETPEAVVVELELAGVREEGLSVTLYADTLVVEGLRDADRPEGPLVYHVAEIRRGPFRVELPIPGRVEREQAIAQYERGILRVYLPRPAPVDSPTWDEAAKPAGPAPAKRGVER